MTDARASAAGPTAELGAFAAGLRLDDVPSAAVAQAKRSLLDTLGCALHGATLPWSATVRELVAVEGGTPEATVWGSDLRTSRTNAALVNATATHGFELDDVHRGGMVHTGALTTAAALAVGEPARIDGATLLAATIAGVEVAVRVGRAVGTQHFAAGYHPQGTIGVFAAAAAAGRAIGLDAAAMRHALGTAGSFASGLMAAQEGAMVKRLHSGRAAQGGVLAALLAARGFTGIPDVFEAEFGGFCSTMAGGPPDLDALTAELGTRWETESIGFKPYASCAAAHTSLEVAGRLRAEHAIAAADVAAVAIRSSTHAQLHCGWRYEPTGTTAAQMSIPYGVARMLVDGAVEARHFTDAAITEPRVVDLAHRVTVAGDPEIDALGPELRYTVRVAIELADGRTVHGEVSGRRGDPDRPLDEATLQAKYRSLAEPVVGAATAARIEQLVLTVEVCDDVAELAAALRRPAADR